MHYMCGSHICVNGKTILSNIPIVIVTFFYTLLTAKKIMETFTVTSHFISPQWQSH